MTFIPHGLSDALWRIVPAPLRSRLRSTVVKRFVRFAPAAVCAVAATQITYIVCLGPAHLTAGLSGFLGWLAGAAVSYVISRWAWERKGKAAPGQGDPAVHCRIDRCRSHPDTGQQAREPGGRVHGPARPGPADRGGHLLLRRQLPDLRAQVPDLPLRPVRRPRCPRPTCWRWWKAGSRWPRRSRQQASPARRTRDASPSTPGRMPAMTTPAAMASRHGPTATRPGLNGRSSPRRAGPGRIAPRYQHVRRPPLTQRAGARH